MTYTDDQRKIINFLREQIDNPEGCNVVVSGQGGTGKTAMLCMLICELLTEGKKIAVAAMTGKATAVIRGKVWEAIKEKKLRFPKENLVIETIQKLTKESQVLCLTDAGETVYTNTWRDPRVFGAKYDVLFIDELSMVPHFISQWWQMSGIRVFGFGDHCQLPEVVTKETKAELNGFRKDLKVANVEYTSGYGVKVLKDLAQQSLTKVLRSDNEVALLCNDLRDFTKSKAAIINIIKDWAKKTDNIQYSNSIQDLETGPDWQIITYTNKLCQEINNELCIGADYPDLEDKIILFDNLNPLNLYNGDVLTFRDFVFKIGMHNKDAQRKLFVCMKWQGKMPNKNSRHPLERRFFDTYVSFRQEIDIVNKIRMRDLPGILERSGYAAGTIQELKDFVAGQQREIDNPGECFQKIVQHLYESDREISNFIMQESESLPRLYMVSADYGYCCTVHKSQGSEFEKVCYVHTRMDRPLVYTAISRAKKRVKFIDLS